MILNCRSYTWPSRFEPVIDAFPHRPSRFQTICLLPFPIGRLLALRGRLQASNRGEEACPSGGAVGRTWWPVLLRFGADSSRDSSREFARRSSAKGEVREVRRAMLRFSTSLIFKPVPYVQHFWLSVVLYILRVTCHNLAVMKLNVC